MSAMAPVPHDHPLMKAWEAYKATPEFDNTVNWTHNGQHVEGALWAAFDAGFKAATTRASELHTDVRAHCDHEPAAGAGAMGAVINYRDQIREGLFK